MPVCPDCKDGAMAHTAALGDGEEKKERICDECGEKF
jgi:ribosomal protein L32